MCVVSNVGDFYKDKWKDPIYPQVFEGVFTREVSREEFNKLKKEVQEIKRLLKNAAELDKVTSQPNCENEDKIGFLRQIFKLLGVKFPEELELEEIE